MFTKYEIHPDGTITTATPYTTADGYEAVKLVGDDGKRYLRLVHRLVAEKYLEGEGRYVEHIDGNNKNNHISNLRWTDSKGKRKGCKRCGRMPIGELSHEAMDVLRAEGWAEYRIKLAFGVG